MSDKRRVFLGEGVYCEFTGTYFRFFNTTAEGINHEIYLSVGHLKAFRNFVDAIIEIDKEPFYKEEENESRTPNS